VAIIFKRVEGDPGLLPASGRLAVSEATPQRLVLDVGGGVQWPFICRRIGRTLSAGLNDAVRSKALSTKEPLVLDAPVWCQENRLCRFQLDIATA
jgi:hypothetical protein